MKKSQDKIGRSAICWIVYVNGVQGMVLNDLSVMGFTFERIQHKEGQVYLNLIYSQ